MRSTNATCGAFEHHLGGCDGCTEYLEQLRVTIRITGTIEPDDLTPEAKTALLQAFRDWKRTLLTPPSKHLATVARDRRPRPEED